MMQRIPFSLTMVAIASVWARLSDPESSGDVRDLSDGCLDGLTSVMENLRGVFFGG